MSVIGDGDGAPAFLSFARIHIVRCGIIDGIAVPGRFPSAKAPRAEAGAVDPMVGMAIKLVGIPASA